MKVLKILGLLILVVILLAVGAIIFGPSEVHMQRETTINSSADAVFAEVQGFRTFDQFSAWSEIDTAARVKIEGPLFGVGASYSWDSDNPDLGKGTIEIVEFESNRMVKSKMSFEGFPGEPTASWILEEADGVTNVRYTYDQEGISGIWKLLAFGTEGMLSPMYERTLEKLKARVESRSGLTAKISLVDVEPITFAGKEATSSHDVSEISKVMGDTYGAIIMALSQNGLNMSGGYPLAITTAYDETTISMICGIPVAEDAVMEEGDVSIMQSPEGMAVRALHFGDYALLKDTHEQINQYAIYYNYEIAGMPWEVYVTDPTSETDTTKWLTEVYYPVK